MNRVNTADGREQAFQSILETDLEHCNLHVCLASTGGDDDFLRFERIQVEEDEELAEDFENVVENVLKKYRRESDAGSLRLFEYEEGAAVSDAHEIEYIDLSAREYIGEQISDLAGLSDLGLFEGSSEFVDGLRFYAIVIQRTDGTTVNFFRSYRPSKEVTRSSGFGAYFGDGHFNKVRQPTFLFDRKLDCVSLGRHMFVLQRNNFQSIFRFFEALEHQGRTTLNEVKAKVPIKIFDEFATACLKHRGKLAKLGVIGASGLLDELDMTALKDTVADFGLSVKTVNENSNEMFVYDSSDQWAYSSCWRTDTFAHRTQEDGTRLQASAGTGADPSSSAEVLQPDGCVLLSSVSFGLLWAVLTLVISATLFPLPSTFPRFSQHYSEAITRNRAHLPPNTWSSVAASKFAIFSDKLLRLKPGWTSTI